MPGFSDRVLRFTTGIKQAGQLAVSGVKSLFTDYSGQFTPGANNLYGPYSWPQLSNVPLTRFRTVSDTLGAYSSVSAVYTCVNTIANAIASLDVEFFDKKSGKTKYKLSEYQGEPGSLAALIQQPNEYMDYRELVETFIAHLELAGNSLWLLENMDGYGRPEALWPLNPACIRLHIDDNKGLLGYTYQIGNSKLTLDKTEVVHKRYANPAATNPFWGQSTIAALTNEIDLTINIQDADRAVYRNGMVIPGAYSTDGTLTDAQFQRLKKQFEQEHQGVQNWWKPLILEGGLKWQQMSIGQTDLNTPALRTFTREQIYMAFGVPVSEAGNQGKANVKNDHLTEVFWRNTAAPKIRRLEAALQEIASRYDPRIGVRIPVPEALDVSALITDAMNVDKLTSLDVTEKRIAIRTMIGGYVGLADIPDELPEPPQPTQGASPALPQPEGQPAPEDQNAPEAAATPPNVIDLTGDAGTEEETTPEEGAKADNQTGPGSRGGKYWIDSKGKVRYDDPPKGMRARTPEEWGKVAKTAAGKELKGIKTADDLKNMDGSWEVGVSGDNTNSKGGYNHYGAGKAGRAAALADAAEQAKSHPDITYAVIKVDGNYVLAAKDTAALTKGTVDKETSRATDMALKPKKKKKADDTEITAEDIAAAADFWDANAPAQYRGLLKAKPLDEAV